MPRVTEETVDHVARLAHLSLTNEERRLFARQLEEILAWAQSLQALDTTGVPAMSQPPGASALREDSPRDGLDRDRVLEQAADPADGLFRVPRVIGG
jgi:aspartyl-tRNA(Asn)/glutamyl-tRNA(Gln) amidotransferase subunit C